MKLTNFSQSQKNVSSKIWMLQCLQFVVNKVKKKEHQKKNVWCTTNYGLIVNSTEII